MTTEDHTERERATGRRCLRAHARDTGPVDPAGLPRPTRSADSVSAVGDGRLFVLARGDNVAGVSGTGPVAEGARFFDGAVVLRWAGAAASTDVWPDLDTGMRVHGHDGRTRAVFADDDRPPAIGRSRLSAANHRRGTEAEAVR